MRDRIVTGVDSKVRGGEMVAHCRAGGGGGEGDR